MGDEETGGAGGPFGGDVGLAPNAVPRYNTYKKPGPGPQKLGRLLKFFVVMPLMLRPNLVNLIVRIYPGSDVDPSARILSPPDSGSDSAVLGDGSDSMEVNMIYY